jgi:hypothetical protein
MLIVVPPDEFASDVETMKLMIDFNRGIVMAFMPLEDFDVGSKDCNV